MSSRCPRLSPGRWLHQQKSGIKRPAVHLSAPVVTKVWSLHHLHHCLSRRLVQKAVSWIRIHRGEPQNSAWKGDSYIWEGLRSPQIWVDLLLIKIQAQSLSVNFWGRWEQNVLQIPGSGLSSLQDWNKFQNKKAIRTPRGVKVSHLCIITGCHPRECGPQRDLTFICASVFSSVRWG